MNIYTHKWNEIELKLMIAITKSLTKDKIDKYILALIIVQYIEDITWLRGDTKFLFKCWKIFHEWAQRTSEIFFQHEKRNFVSPSGHVMFYLLYKHQWNTKPFHFNSFCDLLCKITCYFHMWRYQVFARKLTWYFIGVYIIIKNTKKN